MYLHFATKVDLLIACIDTSLSAIPVRDRADYQAMGTGTPLQRAATAAHWLRSANERSASIQRVLDDAAVSTPRQPRPGWSSAGMTSSPTHAVWSSGAASHPHSGG